MSSTKLVGVAESAAEPHELDAPMGAPKNALPPEVQVRRTKAGYQSAELSQAPTGLALSGGGIRSATFCFGFVRALAQNQVFSRFDYLSTVSGGGYIGAALGRLYDDTQSAQQVEAGIARKDSMLLWWLRNNGRYLTPAGAPDVGQACASVLRGVLATHFEIGVLLMLMSSIMVLPYLILQAWASGPWAMWLLEFQLNAGSFWWWALALPTVMAGHNIFGYWYVRECRQSFRAWLDVAVAVACAVVGWIWGASVLRDLSAGPSQSLTGSVVSALACLLLFTPSTAVAWRTLSPEDNVSRGRLHRTKAFALALWIALSMLIAGALDWLSWMVANGLATATLSRAWAGLLAALPVPLLLLSRWGLPRVTAWLSKRKTRPVRIEKLLNIAGLALLAALALAWATAFQYFAGPTMHWEWLPGWFKVSPGAFEVQGWKWAILTSVPLLYVLATLPNVEMLNLSSLHNFYRARIERAYVSAGNYKRFGPKGALVQATREATNVAGSLREAIDGDDIELLAYAPHLHGGPVHLINCCINQTVDDRTENYNADRKGVALTVSSLGVETGTHPPQPGSVAPGKLSTWAAISGAAASSGLGSRTAPGLAALLFLSGLRLGYWQERLAANGKGRRLYRPELIRAEATARFPGLRSSHWYISDGGHFDNTGVYALLKRQPRLIVAADCGADPDYRFGDVENLVRKAQIDYRADIVFVRPQLPANTTDAEKQLHASIALPDEITLSTTEAAYILLGCVHYEDGSKGTLVILKPRRVPHITLDVAAYASRNATFPQQATSDQFFDEEQWEAYHQLGYQLGNQLTAAHLSLLQVWANCDVEMGSGRA